MTRLPMPNSDADQWGVVLNEFLRVSHHEGGTLRGVCPVANVRDFGARGDGETNDSFAFQQAIDSIPQGGTICVPPGTYIVTDIQLRSGQTIIGSGWTSLLKRGSYGPAGEPSQGIVLNGLSTKQVRIAHLAIDCVAAHNYYSCINASQTEHFTVEGCYLYNSGLLGDLVWTLHAVLGQDGARDLRIEDNLVEGMQIKAAGGGGGAGVFILGNYIRNPHNHGISYVLVNDADVLGAATISQNIIDSPGGGGGIYIGSDINTELRGTSEEILVTNNIVTGTWTSKSSTGILARLCRINHSWLIQGNVIRCKGTFPENSLGILVDSFPGAAIERIAVVDNHIENVDLAGIVVTGSFKTALVHNNTVVGTRGIWVTTNGGLGRAIIDGNQATGAQQGIQLHAQQGNLLCDVHDNMTWDMLPDGQNHSWGLRVIAESGQRLMADVHHNQFSGAQYGIAEEGTGSFETEYAHNKLRGNITPLAVNPEAILHENRV